MLILEAIIIAQLTVPTECVALAQKEGFSQTLTEAEAKSARRRLNYLRVRHPFNSEIKECGRAVDRMKG